MGLCYSCAKRKSHFKQQCPMKRHQSFSDLETMISDGTIKPSNLVSSDASNTALSTTNDSDRFLMSVHTKSRSLDLDEESSAPKKPRNLENFAIIWLDEHIVDPELTAAVRVEVNYLEISDNVTGCINRIFSIEAEKIFVIVSGSYYEQIASVFEFSELVEGIYIFCSDPDKYQLYIEEHSIWVEYKKIIGVFNNINDICCRIRQRRNQYTRQIPTTISISHRNFTVPEQSSKMNKLEASFMYSRLIKDILVSMTPNKNAKMDLINLLRAYYDNNQVQIQRIDEFERDYRPDQAIWWYTKAYCFYGILNKALRTQDIDTLHKMRFFITDIHHQLKKLRDNSTFRRTYKVYRGQSMLKEEFQRNLVNVGGLIAFNQLLSCSMDFSVARTYAISQELDENIVPVLLQITVDPNVCNTSFADVTRYSVYEEEEEFLFSMGTIFRIESIGPYYADNKIQLFNLQLTNDEDEDLKDLQEHMRQEIGGTNDLINFGRLLIEMGDLNHSEQFYKIVLGATNVQDDPRTAAMIYNDLGYIARQHCYNKNALQLYRKALGIAYERFPLGDAQISDILNNIGEIYLELKEFDTAKEYFEEALKYDRNVSSPNDYKQAIRYHNIGMVHKEKEDFRQALKNFNRSLELKQSNLPSSHPSIAISKRAIGDVYRAQGRFDEALAFCEEALEIETKSLPPHHPSLSITHRCIGLIHYDRKRYREALNEMFIARDIARMSLPPTHPDISDIGKKIAMINGRL